MRTFIALLFRAIFDWWREREHDKAYEEALRENERFDEKMRKAEAFKNTTKAVLNETKASPDDIAAVRERLRERAERNSASK